MYEILSDVLPNQNSGAATAVNCIENEVNDCVSCFQKNLWKLKQILKILFKNLKVFKIFLKVFKKMLINISKN